MSALQSSQDFTQFFSNVQDPRVERSKVHQLIDILFISVAGTIAGCDGPSDIEEFARTQLQWCRKFVDLKNGVPAHDTIGRVLSLIKPLEFQKAFVDWIASFAGEDQENRNQPKFTPIDGKTLRGSRGARDRDKPLHLVSAWATQQGLTLGQVAVDEKSNEITAIPKLLEMLELTFRTCRLGNCHFFAPCFQADLIHFSFLWAVDIVTSSDTAFSRPMGTVV